MSKRVIFIAGANHSGSTLAGCILGAHPNPFLIFHAGEIHAYFRKTKRYYFFFHKTLRSYGNPKAALKVKGGEIWNSTDPRVGYAKAYTEIFVKTGTKTIIDSSKTPHHFQTAAKACQKNGWPLHVVITFRPFAKIWQSGLNRNNSELKIKKNIGNYLKIQKKIINPAYTWSILNTEDLILQPRQMTQALCEAVQISYFEGKEAYWNYPSCHLYGSLTQRKHLKNPQNAGYDASKVRKQARIKPPFLQEKSICAAEDFLASHALRVQQSNDAVG